MSMLRAKALHLKLSLFFGISPYSSCQQADIARAKQRKKSGEPVPSAYPRVSLLPSLKAPPVKALQFLLQPASEALPS